MYEYVNGKLGGGWPRKGRMKALNDASVCSLLCFCRMNIPKDMQMLLVRYVRAGVVLALKLERLLKWHWYLMQLVKEDVGLLDQVCRAMHVVDMDDEMPLLGKLLQCVVAEDEEADKAAKPAWGGTIECFRVARWYVRNDQQPAHGMPFAVWECWASFDPPVLAAIDRKDHRYVAMGSSVDMLKRLIALPGWDLDGSLRANSVKGMLKHVALLLEHGADVNAKDDYGRTALAEASRRGRRKVVELLLNHGADVNVKSAREMTALAWATKKGHEKVVEVLIKNGAK